MQHACHAVGSCVNCEIPDVVNIIDLALTRTTTVQARHYTRVRHSPSLSIIYTLDNTIRVCDIEMLFIVEDDIITREM